MNKTEFLQALAEKLTFLSRKEVEERCNYYMEMIDDGMEEGLTENEALAALGSIEDIAAQILADTPLTLLAKERIKPERRLNGWEITAVVLGFPLWFSLLAAAFAVAAGIYASWWAVIISLWAVFVSVAACSVAGFVACAILCTGAELSAGLVMLAAGIFCGGLSIFVFFGCKAVTGVSLKLTKKIALWVKSCFVRKEDAQ